MNGIIGRSFWVVPNIGQTFGRILLGIFIVSAIAGIITPPLQAFGQGPPGATRLSSAPSTPAFAPEFRAIAGSGFLQFEGDTSNDFSSSVVWITNTAAILASTQHVRFTFSIGGGSDGFLYDVFGKVSLHPGADADGWAWLGQGNPSAVYSITNLPVPAAFLILGSPQDLDADGFTDAYEGLVSGTAASNPDSDGDGVSDAVEWLQGRDPLTGGTTTDSGGLINLKAFTPLK